MPNFAPPLTELLQTDRASALAKIILSQRAKSKPATDFVPIWTPNPGPQTQAMRCEADELFYGGAGGGGKTSLLCGLALTAHHESIIFRPTCPELREVRAQLTKFMAGRGDVNQDGARLGERTIEFGFMQHEDDKEKYRGRPHDLIAIDEAPLFTRSQVQFVTTWLRTTRPGQRCRVVLTGNPPSNAEGRWVLEEFAPWLKEDFPDPAPPGELRWYTRDPANPDSLLWSRTAAPVRDERSGRDVMPLSRTFIPALLTDNPFLGPEYFARVSAQPEPLRSQMLYGDMRIGLDDHPWQVIPTAWVREAQARWTENDGAGRSYDCAGVDVARGGKDQTIIARRYGTWLAPLIKRPGVLTDTGPKVAGEVLLTMGDGPPGAVNVDVIGVGSSAYDSLVGVTSAITVVPVNNSEAAPGKDRAGVLSFFNMRAYSWWSLREALDPAKGDNLALPPDRELLADLTAPRWQMRAGGVQVEKKEEIVKRIGRSPDCGDAVVLACLPVVQRSFDVTFIG